MYSFSVILFFIVCWVTAFSESIRPLDEIEFKEKYSSLLTVMVEINMRDFLKFNSDDNNRVSGKIFKQLLNGISYDDKEALDFFENNETINDDEMYEYDEFINNTFEKLRKIELKANLFDDRADKSGFIEKTTAIEMIELISREKVKLSRIEKLIEPKSKWWQIKLSDAKPEKKPNNIYIAKNEAIELIKNCNLEKFNLINLKWLLISSKDENKKKEIIQHDNE
ncbi:uncharacterized protein LOC126904346 [Daktulosphaira vitifoliae]|uniref:uncharacterized protein LOC126904346 n=1 Tax=Daktulosphaira vitifoliae TaxID=58002 RepID=UPI0021AA587D|nr:uncharacterized protein LOC126904346 [Daktulosphaira vitifoliae]